MAGFQQLKVTRTVDFTGATQIGIGSPGLGKGKVLFVDEILGANGYEGTNPNYPKKTITNALAACANDNNDYIIVNDCYDADTYPITINKSRVHVIGIAMPSTWSYPTLSGGGDNVFTVSANYVELAGFSLVSAAANGIVLGNNGYHWIHHVNFAVAAASLAIGITGAGAFGTNSMIEDCYFGYQATNITDDGISGGLTQSTIRNCVFLQIANQCIDLSNNNCRVLHNFFYAPIASAEGDGWAVTLRSGTSGNIVMGNKASQCGNATGDNPYRDLTTGNLATCTNGWADNFAGHALSAGPAIA